MDIWKIIVVISLSFSFIGFIIVKILDHKIKLTDKKIIELTKLKERYDKELNDLYNKEKRNAENMKVLNEEKEK